MKDEDSWRWWLLPFALKETATQKYNRQQVEALAREHEKQVRTFKQSVDKLWRRHPLPVGGSLEEDMAGNYVSFLNSIDDWRDQ